MAQKRGLLLASSALSVFFAAFLVLGIVRFTSDTPVHHQTLFASGTQSASKDELLIRRTIAGMSAAAKTNDFKKMASYFCAKYRVLLESAIDSGALPDLTNLPKPAGGHGRITRIDVHGDTAEVQVTNSQGDRNLEFVKEGENWKFCPAIS